MMRFEELVTSRGNESATDILSLCLFFLLLGDLLQVGAAANDAPGNGSNLGKVRVNAPVLLHMGQQAFTERIAEMIQFMPSQKLRDERIGSVLLQHLFFRRGDDNAQMVKRCYHLRG